MTSVIIPNTVTSIGEGAFRDNQLTSVTIPNSVTFIGDFAFYNNPLRGQTIPSSVTSIRGDAFVDNPLTTITILGNVMLHSEGWKTGTTVFPNNFDFYYNQNGKKAGTYIYDGRAWSMK